MRSIKKGDKMKIERLGLLMAISGALLLSSVAYAKDAKEKEIFATTGSAEVVIAPEFQKTNDKFRELYAEARSRMIKLSQPTIIVFGDEIVLLDGPDRSSRKFISDKYTLLKSVDHISLAVFVCLKLDTDKPLTPERLQQLDQVKRLTQKALASLDKCNLDADTLVRQKLIINKSLAVIEKVEQQKTISSGELQAFCRDISKPVMQNADEGVASQLSTIDSIVRKWRDSLSEEKWNKLKVVIVSGHMPREQQSNMQYFSKLLKQKREGDRLIYCEGLSEENDALNLLATHGIDREIAIAYFDDEWRMHRDLLSDGAAAYLKKHPPLK